MTQQTGQFEVVEQDAPAADQAIGKIALFNSAGEPFLFGIPDTSSLADGDYFLKVSVTDGEPTVAWVLDN